VYSQQELQTLLQKNSGELATFANEWLRNHRDDSLMYEDCNGEKLKLVRHVTNLGEMTIPVNSHESSDLQAFAKRLKLEDVSTLRTTTDTPSWYVQFSFQGGTKWPYGLLYIPDGEPLNLLNSADGGPGPGYSKVVPTQGRWLYFESR
jgi:hypothetical protein